MQHLNLDQSADGPVIDFVELRFVSIRQIRILAEDSYNGAKLPFQVKAGVAADYGDRFQQRYGGYMGIEFNFYFDNLAI